MHPVDRRGTQPPTDARPGDPGGDYEPGPTRRASPTAARGAVKRARAVRLAPPQTPRSARAPSLSRPGHRAERRTTPPRLAPVPAAVRRSPLVLQPTRESVATRVATNPEVCRRRPDSADRQSRAADRAPVARPPPLVVAGSTGPWETLLTGR